MITAESWFTQAEKRGITFFTGVPCSFLTPFINAAISDTRMTYVGAASEGEAVGIACGAWLGGRKSVMMCQNSGFGNTINPLTSLSWTFRIPHLLITTWRGDPEVKDEPQHELMGKIMVDLLRVVHLPFEHFPEDEALIAASLDRAEAAMEASRRPFGFLMRKGTVADCPLLPRPVDRGSFDHRGVHRGAAGLRPELSRLAATRVVLDVLGDQCAYLATTGKLGRELFTIADTDNHFYNVGSMGCVSAIGLGIATTRPERRVVVLDGDGSLLMKMGALATIGHYAPRNLVHIVLDNEAHESTGGQATVSTTVDFATIALGAGYRHAFSAGSATDLRDALLAMRTLEGPILLHQKVSIATEAGLGRPTIHPSDVAARMRGWLTARDHR